MIRVSILSVAERLGCGGRVPCDDEVASMLEKDRLCPRRLNLRKGL
jgi:hypothetical protein